MFKPELPPLKTRIISYIAAVPIAFFIGLFYGLSPLVSAVVAAAFAVLFAAALFFELRSKRRDEEFRKAVQSGEYQQDKEKGDNRLYFHNPFYLQGANITIFVTVSHL